MPRSCPARPLRPGKNNNKKNNSNNNANITTLASTRRLLAGRPYRVICRGGPGATGTAGVTGAMGCPWSEKSCLRVSARTITGLLRSRPGVVGCCDGPHLLISDHGTTAIGLHVFVCFFCWCVTYPTSAVMDRRAEAAASVWAQNVLEPHILLSSCCLFAVNSTLSQYLLCAQGLPQPASCTQGLPQPASCAQGLPQPSSSLSA